MPTWSNYRLTTSLLKMIVTNLIHCNANSSWIYLFTFFLTFQIDFYKNIICFCLTSCSLLLLSNVMCQLLVMNFPLNLFIILIHALGRFIHAFFLVVHHMILHSELIYHFHELVGPNVQALTSKCKQNFKNRICDYLKNNGFAC